MSQLLRKASLTENKKNDFEKELKFVKIKYALLRRFIRKNRPKTSELIKLLDEMEDCTMKRLMEMHDIMFDDQYSNYGYIEQ